MLNNLARSTTIDSYFPDFNIQKAIPQYEEEIGSAISKSNLYLLKIIAIEIKGYLANIQYSEYFDKLNQLLLQITEYISQFDS